MGCARTSSAACTSAAMYVVFTLFNFRYWLIPFRKALRVSSRSSLIRDWMTVSSGQRRMK